MPRIVNFRWIGGKVVIYVVLKSSGIKEHAGTICKAAIKKDKEEW